MRVHRSAQVGAGIAALILGVTACGSSDSSSDASSTPTGKPTGAVKVWAHSASPAEEAALKKNVEAFNASGAEITVDLKLIPEADYGKTVTATKAEDLPDVVEYDGPTMASLVYAEKLQPITNLVSPEVVNNQTASVKTQNTFNNALYGVSQFDSGLGVYGNKKLLDAAGVKYPSGLDDAWTLDEFVAAVGV
ncbi:MAG: ABC transporter substrate-binding protein, partial [Actinomycetota bacterium]